MSNLGVAGLERAVIADIGCGAGLAADGYRALGILTVGWDIIEQPDYPGPVRVEDALPILEAGPVPSSPLACLHGLHVSLPCQAATTAGRLRDAQGGTSRFPDLVTPALASLRGKWSDYPWVVENVDDNRRVMRGILAPIPGESLVMLCGSMFGLEVQRHRLFLANFPLAPGWCDHSTFPRDPDTGKPRPWGVYHVSSDRIPGGGRTARDAEHGRHVMGSRRLLPWDSLKEGFPPAYTTWVGVDLLNAIGGTR